MGLITIFGSTYLVLYSDNLYAWLAPYLGVFERKGVHERDFAHKAYPVILFGCNRIGYDFIESLKAAGKEYLVVDYNPENIEQLDKQGIATLYGDAGD